MRVRGLGDGTSPLGAYAIFVATLLLAVAAFFIGFQIKDTYGTETRAIGRGTVTAVDHQGLRQRLQAPGQVNAQALRAVWLGQIGDAPPRLWQAAGGQVDVQPLPQAVAPNSALVAETCLISRETYTQHQIDHGHAKKGDMPDELVPGFMSAFNSSPPTAGVFDAVTAFVWSSEAAQPVTRLGFFLNDCFVDQYDIPNVMLMRLMQQGASGEEATE